VGAQVAGTGKEETREGRRQVSQPPLQCSCNRRTPIFATERRTCFAAMALPMLVRWVYCRCTTILVGAEPATAAATDVEAAAAAGVDEAAVEVGGPEDKGGARA
jgi:hypothetical protein